MNLRKLFLTNNSCYKAGKVLTVKGIMVHSTGANNPNLKRYIGPNDGLLGQNQYNNHWNTALPGGRQVCVHAFVGKLANGTIATYQTLPWSMRGWHSGSGSNGSANDTHIGFEICEDGRTDATYLNKVYKEAAELCAMLCKEYNLNPLVDGVIIGHYEGYKRGIASNHADPGHWFPKYGKSMDTFRTYVSKLIGTVSNTPGTSTTATTPTVTPAAIAEKVIWDFLKSFGLNDYAIAGVMGNLYAESGLLSNNLQNTYNTKLSLTDAQYTEQVDNGTYTNFVKDSAGYGLAQWTYHSRKQNLLNYVQAAGKSISDLNTQLGFLWKEMQGYTAMMNVLKSATSIQVASDIFLTQFEKPANQSVTVKTKRAMYGKRYYDKYATGNTGTSIGSATSNVPYTVRVTASSLNIRKGPGTVYSTNGVIKDKGIYTIVQESTGTGSTKGWGKLKSGVGWISLDYCTKR